MKKILLITLFLVSSVLASNIESERKIYATIIRTIFPHKNMVYVWADSADKATVISGISFVKVVQNKNDADFLIINKINNSLPSNKKVFADGYLVFKTCKEKLVGGFYWQKGRPNIVFIKNNIEKYNIRLPDDLKKYIE